MPKISRRAFLRATALGSVSAIGLGGLGKYSTGWLQCNQYSFELPRWTKVGYRIAFLSDAHLTVPGAVGVTQRAVEFAIEQKPEIILFGGDFVERSTAGSLNRIAEAFGPLKGCGIPAFAVMGNHDYAANHPDKVIQAATKVGFRMLRNESVELNGVTIFGLDDLTFGHTRYESMAAVANKENVITMLHEPDGLDGLLAKPALMLAGHSHGGQICLPTGTPITTPHGARKYVKGFYGEGDVPLFVSRGIGETGVRLRLFCRPEASILTLNPPKESRPPLLPKGAVSV